MRVCMFKSQLEVVTKEVDAQAWTVGPSKVMALSHVHAPAKADQVTPLNREGARLATTVKEGAEATS